MWVDLRNTQPAVVKMQRMSRRLIVLCAVFLLLPTAHGRTEPEDLTSRTSNLKVPLHRSPEAYVTLLYAEEFLLGVRVLGQSLRETGTKNDLVALISKGVTDKGAELLQVNNRFDMKKCNSFPLKGPTDFVSWFGIRVSVDNFAKPVVQFCFHSAKSVSAAVYGAEGSTLHTCSQVAAHNCL